MNPFIPLSTAAGMTSLYRDERENILKSQFQNGNILPVCETFTRETFETLLSKSGCESIRIYYGMTEDFKIHAIIVSVDANGSDILPEPEIHVKDDDNDDFIAENGTRCPDLCPPSSPLNT